MNPVEPLPMDIRLMNLAALALGVVGVLILVSASLAWLAGRSAFAVGSIRIQGDVAHNNEATLRANVLPRLSGSFFTLDLVQARQAFEGVPWVRRAEVRRQFPNGLRVRLEEHRAVAYWGAPNESRLINSHGEVFEANVGDVEVDDLPRLTGPDAQAAEVLATYRELVPVLERLDLAIEQLSLSPRGSWSIQTDTQAQIELGRGTRDEVLQRLERFVKTLSQAANRHGRSPEALVSADLRYEDGYALRLRGVQTTEPKAGKQ